MTEVDTKANLHHKLTRATDRITYREGYEIMTGADPGGVWFEVVKFDRPDTITGELGTGRGGKRYVYPDWSISDILRNVFGALLAYEEHEVREFFRVDDQRVFSPHMDLIALARQMEDGTV